MEACATCELFHMIYTLTLCLPRLRRAGAARRSPGTRPFPHQAALKAWAGGRKVVENPPLFPHHGAGAELAPTVMQSGAANPKFAHCRCKHGRELRVQKRHQHHKTVSVPKIPKFAPEVAARFCELRNRDTGLRGVLCDRI